MQGGVGGGVEQGWGDSQSGRQPEQDELQCLVGQGGS